jgi:hypothetical protein
VAAKRVDVVCEVLVRETQTVKHKQAGCVGFKLLDLIYGWMVGASDGDHIPEDLPELENLLFSWFVQHW